MIRWCAGTESCRLSRNWTGPIRSFRRRRTRRLRLRPRPRRTPTEIAAATHRAWGARSHLKMNKLPDVVERIIGPLRKARTLCIVGHIRPDGDCVGSQLGLALALQAEGKKVTVWNEDPIPDKYQFLDPDRLIQKPRAGMKFDCVVATDAASFERLGKVGKCIAHRKVLINIDHHESNTRYGDLNWISPREPSSGELILHLLKAARWPVTHRIADCLFTAVSTDTGSFQYSTTRPATYHVAGELVRRGANLAKICDEVYQSYPLSRA